MTPTQEREALESKSGTIALEPRAYYVDQALAVKSGITIEGNGATLKNSVQGAYYPLNCTMRGEGSGFGHVHPFSQNNSVSIETYVASDCPPGTLLYLWKHNGNAPPAFSEQRVVVDRSGDRLRLNSSIHPDVNVMKWFREAWPLGFMAENQANMPIGNVSCEVGSTVLVTNGPNLGNEANGELRTIASLGTKTALLDRPLRRAYKNAAAAVIHPVVNVVVRNLMIETPINAGSEALYLSKCRNWRFENCRIDRMAIGNCSHITFFNCAIGWVQAAASSHDLRFERCRINSITFEEGCHDNTIDYATIGPVLAGMNCVSMRAYSERLTLRNSDLLGGAWPSSQILMDTPGRECLYEDLKLTGRTPCWWRGDGIVQRRVVTDGDINYKTS
jgi:hypothetical protein